MATPASRTLHNPPAKHGNRRPRRSRGRERGSCHLSLNTSGSSSEPARKVRTMAPRPDRNLIQVWSVPRMAEPIAAPMMSWAIVPTTISDSAVEMRNQIEKREAISASPSHSAAKAQISVMRCPRLQSPASASGSCKTGCAPGNKKPALRGGLADLRLPTHNHYAVGVISAVAVQGDSIPFRNVDENVAWILCRSSSIAGHIVSV